MTPEKGWLKRCLTAPLIVIASLLMWVEETLWIWLKWLTAKIAILAWVRRFEALILQLPPYATMVVFLLPMTILFPFKLVAVYWLAQGYWFASLMVILAAKVLGTAIVARMYVVCKPKLMTIAWFKWLHDLLIEIRDRLHAALKALPLYQAVRARLSALKRVAKQFLIEFKSRLRIRARWKAIRLWYRRSKAP